MTPTLKVGKLVDYRLHPDDVQRILHQKATSLQEMNEVRAGQVVAAMVVRVWNPDTGCCNLKVFLDGEFDTRVTSRIQGGEPGEWSWPTE